jgi:hypothetical protein
MVCLTLCGGLWTTEISATPMTWAYTGSIVSSPDESVVAVGTPATFSVTVDPDDNFVAGAPFYPPWAGGYWVDIQLDFSGLHYRVRGAFEVNMDLAFLVPLPGQMLHRQVSWQGPDLFDRRVGCFPQPCAFFFFAPGVDPSSPALPPLPFDPFVFTLPFATNLPFQRPVFVSIGGHDPQLVPELTSVVLVGAGIFALILVRRQALTDAIRPHST